MATDKRGSLLYIVVPCFNEEAVIAETGKCLTQKMEALMQHKIISEKSRILFVDDGSTDTTWSIILQLNEENTMVAGIKLSTNRGHQNALMAGLMSVIGYADVVISIDADLQDDVEAIDDMMNKYDEGYDIVYGVRSVRKTDSFFKRGTAQLYYALMNKMGTKIIYNHADYRLLSKRVLAELSNYHEVNLFLRGIIPTIGFKSTVVYYERAMRYAGKSKYSISKMIYLAIEGITSMSISPIKAIVKLGFSIFFVSILMLAYSVVQYFRGNTVSGWASLIVSIWSIGGLILLAIGVIGEYIGKIYLETKGRPRYIIEESLNIQDECQK